METFHDFFNRNHEMLNSPVPKGENNASGTQVAVVSAVGLSLQDSDMASNDVIKFASQVGSLVTGESFIKELSQKIGRPAPDESEEMFIQRCKSAMIELLGNRLG